MKIIAIATNNAHIASALNMKNEGNFYMEFAKESDWNDNAHPDQEVADTTTLPESQAFAKVDTVSVVYKGDTTSERNDGDDYIVYKGRKWMISSDKDAYKNNAHYLLFQTTIDIQEVPAFTYHQIGIRQGTKIPNDVHTATPDTVTDKGVLYAYENRMAQEFTDSMKIRCSFILEF